MIKVKMTHKKSTKGTHVYEAVDSDASVTTVYIRKSGIQGDPPKKYTLTMVEDNE